MNDPAGRLGGLLALILFLIRILVMNSKAFMAEGNYKMSFFVTFRQTPLMTGFTVAVTC